MCVSATRLIEGFIFIFQPRMNVQQAIRAPITVWLILLDRKYVHVDLDTTLTMMDSHVMVFYIINSIDVRN